MAKNTQRVRSAMFTDKITLGDNAVLRKKIGNGYVVIIPDNASETLTTTKAVLASESGKHFILNAATAFATTLPDPVAGMDFWFHIGAIEPTTTHTVVTNGSANIIVGNLASPDVDGTIVVTAVDADTISFIATKAKHGDFAHVWSDGINWYLDGMTRAFDGMTTTQAS